ncbi:DDE-type integrase/transposase/recombinase [Alkalihalobacillus pseudalcaliphilus]|uniref:DDE-type integrase/transposase/recombinase n=1 Tax=Alkalihalobacillus pseudalcaliphilus TaxID=79884 RepID=UPI00064DB2E2|nr:DDE-type integrase/transposase/recombinase [Alkalihalobacillus pseudalcaliphilus]KMK76262.1 hypothetical protein AB990_13720 [Alkalihalobacillus pseudalcaliphilus]
MRNYFDSLKIHKKYLDLKNWPGVNSYHMTKEDLDLFNRRKKAVELYFENYKFKDIHDATEIQRQELHRLLKRCLLEDKLGVIWGYRALIPRFRIGEYNIKQDALYQNNGGPGSFKYLITHYTELEELIFNLLFRKKNSIRDKRMSKKYIHKHFIKKCKELGISSINEYPFTSRDLGQRSLYAYISGLEDKHFNKMMLRDDVEIETKFDFDSSLNSVKPYQKVQFDGHKIDLIISMELTAPDGTPRYVTLSRVWILTIIDVSTRAIIGYHLCIETEYSSADVLQTIKNAIVPQKNLELAIPNLEYPIDSGLPSTLIPEVRWALWDEFYYDNAKANLSKIVRDRLKKITNCRVNAGPIKSPLNRAIIERFFGTLERMSYHRLPSTTGSDIFDPRRKGSEEDAIKYQITFEELQEITAVTIAQYNSTMHEGIYFSSPLEAMKQKIKQGAVIRTMDNYQKGEVKFFSMETFRTIKGNSSKGRRAHINYENVKYTNELLQSSPGLIGTRIMITVDIEDIRILEAYLEDGSSLGKLRATGKWGASKHSLKLRKEIYKLAYKKLLQFTSQEDPIMVYQEYLKEKAQTEKVARNKLKSMQRNQKEKSEGELVKIDFPKNSSANKFEKSSDIMQQKLIEDFMKKKATNKGKKFRRTITY